MLSVFFLPSTTFSSLMRCYVPCPAFLRAAKDPYVWLDATVSTVSYASADTATNFNAPLTITSQSYMTILAYNSWLGVTLFRSDGDLFVWHVESFHADEDRGGRRDEDYARRPGPDDPG